MRQRVSAFEALMENDEREIRALVDTWLKATQAGDLDTVLRLMSDDVVFLVAGQPPMIGKAAFAAAATAQPGGERPRFEGSSEIEELKVLGDCAFMRRKLSVTMTPSGGRSVTRSGYTLSILQKHEGRWLLARDANLLVPVN
jgi:uncharacterized protein (TIGR02246 family)